MSKRLRLSNGRRLVDDLIRVGSRFPSAGCSGEFDAGMLAKIRRYSRPKISWNVLYMKAYATAAAEIPALRQCYVGFPWGHLYQHDHVVCMLTVSREYEGEERLFFARFGNPQNHSLDELQRRYDYYRRGPVTEIKQFRHQIKFAKAPQLIRSLGYWVMFNLWPSKRASHVGTSGMSLSGYKGVFGNRHLGPLTTILGIDPFPRKGVSRLLFTFDHRVMDGTPAVEALHAIQYFLNTSVRDELAELVGVDPESGVSLDSEQEALAKANLAQRRTDYQRMQDVSKSR